MVAGRRSTASCLGSFKSPETLSQKKWASIMLLVHKIELQPNNTQAEYFARASGIARHAFNWALARWQSEHKAGRPTNEVVLRREYNTIKNRLFPWSREVTKVAPQQAIKTLATLSTGEKVEGPKAHKRLLDRVRRLSRSLSRKKKGSANRYKANKKLARLHARMANIRTDALHKLTTGLVLNNTVIGIENLNVRGMASNHSLARHVMDQSFHEFRRQLEYKAHWYGTTIVVADRWFPSSKLCSSCGAIALVLGISKWTCDCGVHHDRDENAAINLERLAASSAVSACGPGGSGAALAAA